LWWECIADVGDVEDGAAQDFVLDAEQVLIDERKFLLAVRAGDGDGGSDGAGV
jgi:hypothetical protein